MEPGAQLGSYEVVSTIGEGGMGKVFKAHDPKLDRHVALKLLPPDVSTDPDRGLRFEREAKALAAFQHPNIASIYGFEASADGTRFRAGRPEAVVEGAYSHVFGLSYDVGPDGRFPLLRADGGTERPDHLDVILNWQPGLSD